jgi:hypothetical protein
MSKELTLDEHLIGLNEVLQRASCTYDTDTIRELITPDFTLITGTGRVMNAEDFIADVGDSSVKWYNNGSEDVAVRTYNEDCAIVTAILRERFEIAGKITDVRIRFTDTWVRNNGGWRYAAGHASLLERLG